MGILEDVLLAADRAYKVAQKLHDAELQEAIADLRLGAARLKSEMADLRAGNAELRESIGEMKRQADIRSKVQFRNGMYYLTEELPGYGEGPFCPTCYDSDGKLITLLGPGRQRGGWGETGAFEAPDGSCWTCRRCAKK